MNESFVSLVESSERGMHLKRMAKASLEARGEKLAIADVAFVFDCDYRTRDLMLSWEDGLREALGELRAPTEPNVVSFNVHVFAPGDGPAQFNVGGVVVHQDPLRSNLVRHVRAFKPDIVLCWGSVDRPLHGSVKDMAPRAALCFAGGPTQHPFLSNFDLVFAETPYHVETFRQRGVNVRQAFGVNTELFKPNIWQAPHFLAIQPASFAAYKRYGLFAKAFEKDGLAVGQVQLRPDGTVFEGEVCHEVCLRHGVAVIPRMVPYYLMPYMYGLAKTCVITTTTYGGGDRAVLEAMACGKPAVICSDNEKLKMLVGEAGYIAEPNAPAIRETAERAAAEADGAALRAYVLENYSVEVYARQLREGLESLLS